MQFPKADFGAGLPIDSIGPGFFRVAGQVWRAPIVIGGGQVCAWGGFSDTASLAELAGRVDLVLIGTGAHLAPVPQAVHAALAEAGVMVDAMPSASASRSYNHLLAEGRRVAAALLPLPTPAGPA